MNSEVFRHLLSGNIEIPHRSGSYILISVNNSRSGLESSKKNISFENKFPFRRIIFRKINSVMEDEKLFVSNHKFPICHANILRCKK